MAVDAHILVDRRQLQAAAADELAEGHDGFFQLLGPRVVREQAWHLIAEHREATGLEHQHRHTLFQHRRKLLEDLRQVGLGLVDHPHIVIRAAAANVALHQFHAQA